MVIKPPSGISPGGVIPPSPAPTQAPKGAPTSTQAPSGIVNPEAVAKAVKDYQSLERKLKKPFMSGAAGLFADKVVFPGDLLDPTNPANDPKYLHLLTAVLKLTPLTRYFATGEQAEEMDSWEDETRSGDGSGEKEKKEDNEESEF